MNTVFILDKAKDVFELPTEETSTVWQDITSSVSAYWEKLRDGFDQVDPEHFGSFSLFWIILGLGLGVVLTILFTTLYHRIYGPFVRKLLERGTDVQNAATLAEIGFDKPLIRFELSRHGKLSHVVSCAEAMAHTASVLEGGAQDEDAADASPEDTACADGNAPKRIKDRDLVFSCRGKWQDLHFFIGERHTFVAQEHFSEKSGRLLPMFVGLAAALVLTWLLLLYAPNLISYAVERFSAL